MNKFLPALAILLLCAWDSRELIYAWQSQQESAGSIAFLIWMLPIIDTWLIRRKVIEPNQILLLTALVISLIGTLGSVNTIHYIALSLAIAAFLPFTWLEFPWWLCMITWTPAFGWIALRYFPNQLQIIRCLIAMAGSFWMIFLLRKKGD